MIRRLLNWLQHRQSKAHCTDEVIGRAQERIDHMERIVEDDRQDRERVNFLYDRITGKGDCRNG